MPWPAPISSGGDVVRAGRSVPAAAAAAVAVLAAGCGDGPTRAQAVRARAVHAVVAAAVPELSPAEQVAIVDAVTRAERESGVDALLLVAVIERESRFRADARSHVGAVGLMQVRRGAARRAAELLGLTDTPDLRDVPTNVRLGAAYLAELERDLGSLELALAAYNRGPSAVRRRLRRGQAVRSRYAGEVLRRYQELRRLGGREATTTDADGL